MDLISRQDAVDEIANLASSMSVCINHDECRGMKSMQNRAIKAIENLPSVQPEQHWIPCSERLPEELAEVNVTWVNTNPEPYYDFVKDKPATGSAVYYKGGWYWYSSVTVDVLVEYGRMESEKMDDAIKVLAWCPLPEPWRGENETN